MQIYLRENSSLTTLAIAHIALWSSSPYIDLTFTNTMSQNHTTADGILGRNQIDNTMLNIVG